MKRYAWVVMPALLLPLLHVHGPAQWSGRSAPRPQHATHLAVFSYGGPPVDEQVDQLDADRAEAARNAAEAAAAEAARAAEALAARQYRAPAVGSPTAPPNGHSEAFWIAVARNEEGGANDPFFGFFGKIDGAWAGLGWDEQVARANALIAAYGDSAWAATSIAYGYAASPSG